MSNENLVETTNQPQEINDSLIYNALIARAGGKFNGPPGTVKTFENICKNLHTTANKIARIYQEVCQQQFNLDPGKIEIVLGGGRVKGKPLTSESDLDLFIFVEKPDESIDLHSILNRVPDPLDAMDLYNLTLGTIIDKVTKTCEDIEIPNLFHIMQYSAPIQEKYNNETQILLTTFENEK
jgi:hypothetical protein